MIRATQSTRITERELLYGRIHRTAIRIASGRQTRVGGNTPGRFIEFQGRDRQRNGDGEIAWQAAWWRSSYSAQGCQHGLMPFNINATEQRSSPQTRNLFPWCSAIDHLGSVELREPGNSALVHEVMCSSNARSCGIGHVSSRREYSQLAGAGQTGDWRSDVQELAKVVVRL
jgi:hypothetical protein